jgi:hypothetical protein
MIHIRKVSSSVKAGRTVGVVFVLALIAVGAGILIAWSMGNHVTPVIPTETPGDTTTQPDTNSPGLSNSSVIPPATEPGRGAFGRPFTNTEADLDPRPWDQKLDGILLGAGEPSDKADSILALLKVSPADAQPELAQHLINMAQDDHYDGVAGLLTNATTQTAVSTILMNDLLNRRNTLKLPMLLAIARNDDHPLKDQAKDMLELFLQADYGADWNQWSSAVDNWLQANQ